MKADKIIKNAKIFTSNKDMPQATSLAVKDGKFIYVGDEAGLSDYEGDVTDLNGIILTKMDGTSKGGIIIPIKHLTGVPVRYVTTGEEIDDIQTFDFDLYLESIIGELKHAA